MIFKAELFYTLTYLLLLTP